MTKLSPLVFFGTENFSVEILKGLIGSDFEVEAVITKPDLISGRGQKKRSTGVKQLAVESNIPVFEAENKDSIRQAIAKTSCQTGVLASFGKIIPEDVIAAFKNGIINVHPSLLPLHRGPSPIENSILNGDTETGVSIMLLANEVDAGDVYDQAKIILTGKEKSSELYRNLAKLGSDVLITTLTKIESGLKAKPQDSSRASFSHMLTKSDGMLDPIKYTAYELERRVRAYEIWPKPRIIYKSQDIIIVKATADKESNSDISISCKDNTYLNIRTTLSPSGKVTTAQQYVNNFLTK